MSAGLANAAEGAAPPPFQPGEISIGEPIALPFSGPAAGDAARTETPSPRPRPEAEPAAGSVPGSGWLGLAVGESSVPGRWRVEEVAVDGPAARAGIVVGDELRAVNGVPLASAEEVSQALTAIAVGQPVRVAVARSEQVSDIVLQAAPRPATRSPGGAGVQEPATAAAPAPAAPTPEWQSSPARQPSPPAASSASPFARVPDPTPRVAVSPTPRVSPTTPGPSAIASPSPGLAAAPSPTPSPARPALGVRTVPIDAATQARFNLSAPTGAYVIGVVQDLPAAKAGVPPGSVIVAVGEQEVRSPVELTRLVTAGPLDRPVTVQYVLPGGEEKLATVRLEPLEPPLARALSGADPIPVTAPVLEPGPSPRRAERPALDESAIRAEVRALRGRLERLERLLDPATWRGR